MDSYQYIKHVSSKNTTMWRLLKKWGGTPGTIIHVILRSVHENKPSVHLGISPVNSSYGGFRKNRETPLSSN